MKKQNKYERTGAKTRIYVSARIVKILRGFQKRTGTSPSETAVRAIGQVVKYPPKQWIGFDDPRPKTIQIYPRLWKETDKALSKISRSVHTPKAVLARRALAYALKSTK